MSDREKLLESLGLGNDATQEDIEAALDTARSTLVEDVAGPSNPAAPHNPANPGPGVPGAPTPANQPPSNPAQPANPTSPTAAPQPYDELVAAAKAAGMVLVDEGAWTEVQEGARVAREMAASAARSHRDTTIAAAIKAGKFPLARKAHWETLWDNDPTGTEQAIGTLQAGLVPTQVRGTSAQDLVEGGQVPTGEQYPASWKPARVRNRELAASRNGGGTDLGD